ncbi:MAG: transcription-repair coupling factor, partial [Acetobacter sp.]
MTAKTGAHSQIATIWGVPEGYDALLLARRAAEHKGPVLHIARSDAAMTRLADMLAFVAADIEVLRFPAWDCLPYDRVSPNPTLVAERVATLTRLLEPAKGPRLVLTTVNAAVQRVAPRKTFEGQSLTLRTGESLDQAFLIDLLIANGYTRTDTVMEAGEFATRGGIFDLYPAGAAEPLRLDLFGDEVENIRAFDPGSQRSTDRRDSLVLCPVSEFSLDAGAISRFRTGWRDVFGPGAAADPLYENVSDGRRYPGLEHWLPLFHEQMETLFDYLPGAAVSLEHQVAEGLAARLDMIADHYQARRQPAREGEVPYRALPPHLLYLDQKGWDAALARLPVVAFSPYAQPDGAGGVDV